MVLLQVLVATCCVALHGAIVRGQVLCSAVCPSTRVAHAFPAVLPLPLVRVLVGANRMLQNTPWGIGIRYPKHVGQL